VASPTQRTLQLLRNQGYTAQVVERYCAHSRRRIDLFGVIDVLAVSSDIQGTLGVQTTSGSNVSSRLDKIRGSKEVRTWLRAGNRLVIHGWKKYKKPENGKFWRCRELVIGLEDLD